MVTQYNGLCGKDMSFSDLGVELSKVSLDGLTCAERMESDSSKGLNLEEQRLLMVQSPNKQYLVLKPADFKALGSGYHIICYADSVKGTLNKPSGESLALLPEKGIDVFMESMGKVLALVGHQSYQAVPADVGTVRETKKSASSQILESRGDLSKDEARAAFRNALQMVTKEMANNIDFWTAEAGARLVKSTVFKSDKQIQRAKSDAQYLRSTSTGLTKCFHQRLNQCLREGKPEDKREQMHLAAYNLSMAEDQEWCQESAIRVLTGSVTDQAQLEFSHVNRRLSFLLDRRVKPEQNVIGPAILSWCLCSALGDVSYSKEQINSLYKVSTEFFERSVGKVYHDINQLWVEMGIIPEIKLRVWRDEYQPHARSRAIG